MEVTKRKREYIDLDHIPRVYDETKDLTQITEEIWPFLMQMLCMFVRDVDIRNDFLLHFYERLPLFFETYQRYTQSPFTPFLVTYSKNLFNNFIRHHRRKQIKESHYYESLVKKPVQDSFYYREELGDLGNLGTIEDSNQVLAYLPMDYKVMAKLYLGIELSLEELRFLVEKINSPQRVADFLTERRQRKERECQNYKAKRIYRDNRNIRELAHLAKFFSVSKSTISRRLEASTRYLHKEDS